MARNRFNMLLWTLFMVYVGVQSASFAPAKPSDMEVGTYGPGDIFLSRIPVENEPKPGVLFIDAGIQGEYINITYITAVESGRYPDARSRLLAGGPGYNHGFVRMTPGPSLGFNYTIDVYGKILAGFAFNKKLETYREIKYA